MKVLIVTPYVGANCGGPAKSVIESSQALGKLLERVDIVTTNSNGATDLEIPLNIWINKEKYRIKYFSRCKLFDNTLSYSLTLWLLKNIKNYDLVHINTVFSYPVIPTFIACKLNNIPYLRAPRGMLEPWALSYKAWKKKIYYFLIEKPMLQQANTIQALVDSEAKNIRNLEIKSPIVIIPNGIHRHDFEHQTDPNIFYQQYPQTRNKNLILFLGRIDPKKGLDLLASALGKVHHQFPQTHLIIAGPDTINYSSQIKRFFLQEKCLEATTFTGMLTGSLKKSALAAADLYVNPSYSEGFSMSVLEGMASGLPCIITKGCNFPEAAEAKVAHVVNIDTKSITNALINCLQNPQQAQAMGMQARQFIFDNYTWDIAAQKLVKVYQQILNN